MASAKNQLQEILQKAGQILPQYEVKKEGTPQYGVFRAKVTVQWEGRTMEEWGQGQKKKAAEMAAAENMLKRIREKRMSPAVCSGGRLTMPLIEPRTVSGPSSVVKFLIMFTCHEKYSPAAPYLALQRNDQYWPKNSELLTCQCIVYISRHTDLLMSILSSPLPHPLETSSDQWVTYKCVI